MKWKLSGVAWSLKTRLLVAGQAVFIVLAMAWLVFQVGGWARAILAPFIGLVPILVFAVLLPLQRGYAASRKADIERAKAASSRSEQARIAQDEIELGRSGFRFARRMWWTIFVGAVLGFGVAAFFAERGALPWTGIAVFAMVMVVGLVAMRRGIWRAGAEFEAKQAASSDDPSA